MTAFVIDLRADKLVIGADTLGYAVCGNIAPLGFVNKVYAIPRLKAVLFGRGILEIGCKAAFDLMLSPHVKSFAEAVDGLPAILTQATGDYAERMEIEDAGSTQIFEACFGGWDAKARRIRLMTLYNYQDYQPEELPAGVAGTMTMPVLPPEFQPGVAGVPLDKRLIEGLHACRRYYEAHPERTGGLSLVGGEIEKTEITRDGIAIRTIGRFSDYEQTRNAGAAVVARYLRGQMDLDVREGLVRAGEMIVADGNAEPSAAVADLASGASRAERRRAEKEARRAARRAA